MVAMRHRMASSGPEQRLSGSSAGTYADGTYTGSTVAHRYGSVAVTVTIQGGQITSVTENVVSDGERKSNQINSRAVRRCARRWSPPTAASVSTVSGATYTSKAYLTSLQSAPPIRRWRDVVDAPVRFRRHGHHGEPHVRSAA